MKKDITIIMGPTAIGKSDYAVKLALKTHAEIISADAFQVYRGMDIGTAKPSIQTQKLVPHHLIDIKNPDEPYSVAEFLSLTEAKINEIRLKNRPIILCGGTAFYLYAFLYQFEFTPHEPDPALRKRIYEECDQIGNQALWEKLKLLDPQSAERIQYHNTRRLIRAFELLYQTQKTPSEIRKRKETPRADTHIIELTAPREIIYERINTRVDQMIQEGLISEVEGLLKKGYSPDLSAFQGLGYKETIQYIKGDITQSEMIEYIKQKTRNFAKRQLTWYKKFDHVLSMDITEI